ncbi:hypothetical protein C8J31_11466 [Rhizobium sp. PP-CC-2G-626]|nr:hypothetical protein C8J31_11466 [Rhizobium sp. PP-CC-2G-626]
MKRKLLIAAAAAATLTASAVNAECFGEGSYRVCSDSYQDADGDIHVRSSDTDGNSYSVDSTTRTLPGGGSEITSADSEGNSYSVRSWSDSEGVHSVDSDGNRCTITKIGTLIGCGQ